MEVYEVHENISKSSLQTQRLEVQHLLGKSYHSVLVLLQDLDIVEDVLLLAFLEDGRSDDVYQKMSPGWLIFGCF